jgi:SAM-dependent methyltransferase
MNFNDLAWSGWLNGYKRNIMSMIQSQAMDVVLDVGCGDGSFLRDIVLPNTVELHGIESHEEKCISARSTGINVVRHDICDGLPYENCTFDLVIGSFIIEHLIDVDIFVKEVFRTLKPGGSAIIGTENLASWHNVGALILGEQPFTSTIGLSSHYRLGNRFQGGRLTKIKRDESPHCRIFTLPGLKDMFTVYGFTIERAVGAGYFPFPGSLGNKIAKLDPLHAALILVHAKKPV